MPCECTDAVERAKKLGRELYLEDVIAARATDVAMEEGLLPGDRLSGWVTTHADDTHWVVHFLGERESDLVEAFSITFAKGPPPHVTRYDPPKTPDAEVAHLFRARQAAIREPFEKCSDAYNTVVLPADRIGERGTLVYLLAATTTDDWMLGGHVRRVVDGDGRVVRTDRMSMQCLQFSVDARADFAMAVNLLWPCPTELHVWVSLLRDKPLVIRNASGVWFVSGDEVRFAGTCQEKTQLNAAICPRAQP